MQLVNWSTRGLPLPCTRAPGAWSGTLLTSYFVLHAAMFSGVLGNFAAYFAGASPMRTTMLRDAAGACRMHGSCYQAYCQLCVRLRKLGRSCPRLQTLVRPASGCLNARH